MHCMPKLRGSRAAIFLMILALAAPGAFAARTEDSEETASSESPTMSPAEKARSSYNRALEYRDKAWGLEQKAETAGSEKEASKLLQKTAKEYEKATRALRSAVNDDPTMHQAWTMLGYTLRKSGEFGESLAAYDRALELRPGFPEALEYRAEAYLGLGRLEEAQEAYMDLLRADREHADELLGAMRRWVEERRSAPSELDAAQVEAFAGWVDERSKLAEQASLGPGSSSRSW
jgi:tetratricopeptide (TPR) repeat protein